MRRLTWAGGLALLPLLASAAPAPAPASPSGAAANPAASTATPADLEQAAEQSALALDGLIRPCPPLRSENLLRCVASDLGVEATRKRLSAVGTPTLYGAWRAANGAVYNWVKVPGGYLNLNVLPDPANSARALVVLSLPSSAAPAKNAAPAATPPNKGATVGTTSPQATPPKPPPVTGTPPLRRPLRLTSPRLNGEDVRTLQNRLMDVSGVARGQGGDGWYGPVTRANVTAFQAANGLPATGVVDAATWKRLFSAQAKPYDPKAAEALAKP